jgi:hypothetical protein
VIYAARRLSISRRARQRPPRPVPPSSVSTSTRGPGAFASDFCDSTLAIVGVDLSGDPRSRAAISTRFRVQDSLPIAPLTTASLGLSRAPGALACDQVVRRHYRGRTCLPRLASEGQLCGVRIDSR